MLEAGVAKHRFTVEEFRKMGQVGILGEDDRVELVEGEIVEMTPIGWRHVESVNALTGVLADHREAGRFVVSVQNPLVLGEHGEHYPDLVLYQAGVRGRVPEAMDTLVVVEVADTSVSYDRNTKLPLYASAGVPEAWLVDLRAGVVEVHSGPRAGGYGTVGMYTRGEVVRSATLAEVVAFGANEVLPG
ncbi:MAG: COG1355, Predicted dioxygenase [uncultured Rubrobacteraceae bacterium]|uniref:COG1355, Predicted dioxygenase n=1 Tax=uncultured Rubrobacteraceae bacterium TaxID=349277 RepID=A0A6J4RAI8_9ACTN|nr:MAG: COG1355, Predicted dioxygenase [uncultured Rubrobacteraceae bacterium]